MARVALEGRAAGQVLAKPQGPKPRAPHSAGGVTAILIALRADPRLDHHLHQAARALRERSPDWEAVAILPGESRGLPDVGPRMRILPRAGADLGTLVAHALRNSTARWVVVPGLAPETYCRAIEFLWDQRRPGQVAVAPTVDPVTRASRVLVRATANGFQVTQVVPPKGALPCGAMRLGRRDLARLWQRRRFRVILDLLRKHAGPGRVLDVGCGSSRILGALPGGVGIDISLPKLRHQRRSGSAVAQADARRLPFPCETFDAVVCSELVEHLPPSTPWAEEIGRVLKPDGVAIIGTPDYGRLSWRLIERAYRMLMPHGYADDHVSRYTAGSLDSRMAAVGLRRLKARYVWASELIAVYVRNRAETSKR